MDNLECTLESNERQEATLNLPPKKQCAGVEIVRSAAVSRRRYFEPHPARRPVRSEPEPSAHDRLTVLRGQLRLLRLRAEAGLPVDAAAIGRAERLAISLEASA